MRIGGARPAGGVERAEKRTFDLAITRHESVDKRFLCKLALRDLRVSVVQAFSDCGPFAAGCPWRACRLTRLDLRRITSALG